MRVFISAFVAIVLIAGGAGVALNYGFQESASTAFTSYGVRGPATDNASE
jgi:hypothetical protein